MPSSTGDLLRRLDRLEARPVIVASHPRSGTHLCIDTLRLNLPPCASWKLPLERSDRLYLDLDAFCNRHRLPSRTICKLFSRVPRPLIKTHAYRDLRTVHDQEEPLRLDPALLDWLRAHATFVYTYRDGRQALCSHYTLYHRPSSRPKVTLSQFLRQRHCGMSRVKAWARHVEGWIDDPSVYCVTMRELLHHTPAIFPGLAEKLGLTWDAGRKPVLPPKNGFDIMSRMRRRLGVRPQSTAVQSDPTHPTPDWRTAFTEADREFFAEESGDLLVRLGYEDSDHWVDPRYDDEERFPALFALQKPRKAISLPPRFPVLSPSYSACSG